MTQRDRSSRLELIAPAGPPTNNGLFRIRNGVSKGSPRLRYTSSAMTILFAEESMKNPSLSLRRSAAFLAGLGLLLALAAAPASAAPQKAAARKKAARPTVEEARKL